MFSAEHAYFRAIEDYFIGRRGAPLLLSPKDWEVARRWFEAGIAVPIVTTALREIFDEKVDPSLVRSLAFCDRRVRRRWRELGAVLAADVRVAAGVETPDEVVGALEALATSLPDDLPDRETWEAELRACGGIGDVVAVEEALAQVEVRLLAALLAGLPGRSREAIERRADQAFATLGRNLPTDAAESARARLVAQEVRRRFGLPRLSVAG